MSVAEHVTHVGATGPYGPVCADATWLKLELRIRAEEGR